MGKYVKVIGGFAFKSEYFTEEGIPIVRISDIQGGTVSVDKVARIPEAFVGKGERYAIEPEDILIAMSGATTGKIGLVPLNLNGLILQNQRVGNFKVTAPEKIHKTYLKHFVCSAAYQRQIFNTMAGAAQPNISSKQLENIEIPIPSLHEQRRIAAILDQADALRAKRREALAQLDSLTQSIFIEMFGDPVTNPKGWPLKKLSDVGSLDRGVSKHRPRNAPELLGGEYPLVQTGGVANCDGYIRSHNSSYSELGLRQSKLWTTGTLCITIAANIAKTGILMFDACFPDSVVGFSAEKQETVEYVRVWLSFLQRALEAAAPESAQKNINLAILRDLDIPLPPISMQKNFADRVSATENIKITHRASLAELDILFASLQHRAFRGEL